MTKKKIDQTRAERIKRVGREMSRESTPPSSVSRKTQEGIRPNGNATTSRQLTGPNVTRTGRGL